MSEPKSPRPLPGQGRETCFHCFRPIRLCYCSYLPEVRNRTRVVIVQHPREEFHSLGTARLAERALLRCDVARGSLAQLRARLGSVLVPREVTYVLFPSESAVDLVDIRAGELVDTFVVLDGTWPQAKSLLRELPELKALPAFRFRPEAPSEYRIRRPPEHDYLSTIESIAEVLSVLEPETDVRPLRTLFRQFIDKNIDERRVGTGPMRRKERAPRPSSFPPEVAQSRESAFILYAQTARRNEASVYRGVRIGSGPMETFEFQALSEVLEHMGPSSVLVSWAKGPLDELARQGYAGAALCLKAAFCNRWQRQFGQKRGQSWGGIEEALAREKLSVEASSRSELRLSGSIALWRRLTELDVQS
jgi:DTW domain-containing protein YfiP